MALRHAMQLQGGLRPEQERAAHGPKTRADNLAQKGKAEEVQIFVCGTNPRKRKNSIKERKNIGNKIDKNAGSMREHMAMA